MNHTWDPGLSLHFYPEKCHLSFLVSLSFIPSFNAHKTILIIYCCRCLQERPKLEPNQNWISKRLCWSQTNIKNPDYYVVRYFDYINIFIGHYHYIKYLNFINNYHKFNIFYRYAFIFFSGWVCEYIYMYI